MKRVFIVHGWGGTPQSDFLPWLAKELESRGFEVHVPSMPDTNYPKIEPWVKTLSDLVGEPDENAYFVGHSIGGQTVLRYLGQLDPKAKVGGVLIVASWVGLRKAAFQTKEDEQIAKPWLSTPLPWEKMLVHTDKFTAIFSDDDPFVNVSDSEIFKTKLGAKIIIEKGMGHMNDEFNIKQVPSALSAVLELSGRRSKSKR